MVMVNKWRVSMLNMIDSRCRLEFQTAPLRLANGFLIERHNRIAKPNHALDNHHPINASFIVVETIDCAEHLWLRLSRVRVQRDHLAARVLVGDHQYGFTAYAQLAADEFVLRVARRGSEIDVKIGPEPAFIDRQARL